MWRYADLHVSLQKEKTYRDAQRAGAPDHDLRSIAHALDLNVLTGTDDIGSTRIQVGEPDILGFANGTWNLDGNPYGLKGLLIALNMPDPIDIAMRNATETINDSGKTILSFDKDAWLALKYDLLTLKANVIAALEKMPGCLVTVMSDRLDGVPYSEMFVQNGINALEVAALESQRRSSHNYFNARGNFHNAKPLEVIAVIPGALPYGNATVASAYIIYKGNANKRIESINRCIDTIESAIDMVETDRTAEFFLVITEE